MDNLETKVASPSGGYDDVLVAFEAFKDANDERLEQIEKRMSADVITSEKVDRINKSLDELMLKSRRPVIGAEMKTEPSEHKKAFDSYVRKGETHGLFSLEAKAMSWVRAKTAATLCRPKWKLPLAACCHAPRPCGRSPMCARFRPRSIKSRSTPMVLHRAG